jgi:hypothetical protein
MLKQASFNFHLYVFFLSFLSFSRPSSLPTVLTGTVLTIDTGVRKHLEGKMFP